ncbi:MAG TPA: M15 family metallopeptidase [Humibacter sp.]|jgi:D-alanyl-D-alanine dipeptidase|nr:M15 family metallopeptidase [Humibacter sp.]
MNDPIVMSISVDDVGEPPVDLEAIGLVRFSDRKRATNSRLSFVREEVAARVEQAAKVLPSGVRFLGVEAFRPPELQRRYYRHYWEGLESENPDLTEDELSALTARFVSPPDVAPHPSGAAIDLTLCDNDGRDLYLGSPVDATPEASAGACFTDATSLTPEASENRKLLVKALAGAGLVNYPTEWWHWSYGDRYWAVTTGAGNARYGPVPAP